MYHIVTDTSANLPTQILKRNNVTVIPFPYFVNGEAAACPSTEAFNGKYFFEMMLEGAKVTTSQINAAFYASHMRPILSSGENILFIGMSSGISGSFNSAQLAADQLEKEFPGKKIRLVDTLGASLGEGLLVLKAVKEKLRGVSLDDIYAKLLDARHRLCNIFTVENLKYLRNTGRLSNMASFVGNLLHIKPLLKGNENGRIVAFSRIFGRRKSIEALAERYDEYVVHPEEQTVGIAHADCEEDAELLSGLIRKNNPPKEILTVCYEPVTGSHVGPGTLALFFEAKDGCRSMGETAPGENKNQ